MKIEIIKEVVVNDKNELLIKVIGDGNPMYQYVYREAARMPTIQKRVTILLSWYPWYKRW